LEGACEFETEVSEKGVKTEELNRSKLKKN
jgi:hypothetical protein